MVHSTDPGHLHCIPANYRIMPASGPFMCNWERLNYAGTIDKAPGIHHAVVCPRSHLYCLWYNVIWFYNSVTNYKPRWQVVKYYWVIYYSTPHRKMHFINFPKLCNAECDLCSADKGFCCWMHINILKAQRKPAMLKGEQFCSQFSLCTSIQ